jgi:hypothetical protein
MSLSPYGPRIGTAKLISCRLGTVSGDYVDGPRRCSISDADLPDSAECYSCPVDATLGIRSSSMLRAVESAPDITLLLSPLVSWTPGLKN